MTPRFIYQDGQIQRTGDTIKATPTMDNFRADVVATNALTRAAALHVKTRDARLAIQFAGAQAETLLSRYAGDIAKMEAEAKAIQAELDRVQAFEQAVEKVLKLRKQLRDAEENIAFLKDDIAKEKARHATP